MDRSVRIHSQTCDLWISVSGMNPSEMIYGSCIASKFRKLDLFAHTIVRFARCGSCDKMKSVVGVLYDKTDRRKSKRDKTVADSVLGAASAQDEL